MRSRGWNIDLKKLKINGITSRNIVDTETRDYMCMVTKTDDVDDNPKNYRSVINPKSSPYIENNMYVESLPSFAFRRYCPEYYTFVKIDNVRYTPLQSLRSPQPDSPYHVDGGVSLREPGTDYAVWLD